MHKMLSILATTATLAISGAASAQVIPVIPAVIPVMVVQAKLHNAAPGYYRFDDTRYMVLRSRGRLLSNVENNFVHRLYTDCDEQTQMQVPLPNPGHDKPIDMDHLSAAFSSCVHFMLDKATRQNDLPGDYIIMQSSVDSSDIRVVAPEPDEGIPPVLQP